MKTVLIIFAVLFFSVFVIVPVIACCKVSGQCSREEENHPVSDSPASSPCDSCLRWPECNGVDESCLAKRKE